MILGGSLAQVDGNLRNLQLRAVGVSGEMRDRMAIEFAAGKIHARISLGGIGSQHPLEHNQRLQQIFPRRFRQLAQTANQIAHPLRLIRLGQYFLGPRGEFLQRY